MKPMNTAESIARELVAGLEDCSLTLEADVKPMTVAEWDDYKRPKFASDTQRIREALQNRERLVEAVRKYFRADQCGGSMGEFYQAQRELKAMVQE